MGGVQEGDAGDAAAGSVQQTSSARPHKDTCRAVLFSKDGQTVGGTSIMGLMMLAASPGCFITVSVTGSDAGDAMAAIAELVESGFGEESW